MLDDVMISVSELTAVGTVILNVTASTEQGLGPLVYRIIPRKSNIIVLLVFPLLPL